MACRSRVDELEGELASAQLEALEMRGMAETAAAEAAAAAEAEAAIARAATEEHIAAARRNAKQLETELDERKATIKALTQERAELEVHGRLCVCRGRVSAITWSSPAARRTRG